MSILKVSTRLKMAMGESGVFYLKKFFPRGLQRPILIAISRRFEKRNRTLDAQQWVEFFAQVVLQAHEESLKELYFWRAAPHPLYVEYTPIFDNIELK